MAGASGQSLQEIGESMVGNRIKIHLIVDSCSNPIDFILIVNEVRDSNVESELLVLLPLLDHCCRHRLWL